MRTERYLAWVHAGNQSGLYVGMVAAVIPVIFGMPLLIIVAVAVGGFALGKLVGFLLMSSSGHAAQIVYAPPGAGRYASTHSNIDALEARGDFRGAVAAWEALSASQTSNAWPLIRAGELYLRELG